MLIILLLLLLLRLFLLLFLRLLGPTRAFTVSPAHDAIFIPRARAAASCD